MIAREWLEKAKNDPIQRLLRLVVYVHAAEERVYRAGGFA